MTVGTDIKGPASQLGLKKADEGNRSYQPNQAEHNAIEHLSVATAA